MIPVILESPYAGAVQRNKAYLQLCIRDCIARGESPFASHQMFTDALNDLNPVERKAGMEAVLAWSRFAQRSVVYVDFGCSRGMDFGIALADREQRPVEYRNIFDDADACRAFCTPADLEQDTPWEELLARALANSKVIPPHGACIIVVKRDPANPSMRLVLGIEGPKGTGLPGGRVEPGEQAFVAAMRELLEETGLAVKAGATLSPLEQRPTDNGDIAHGFWLEEHETFGKLCASKEGEPVWLRPVDFVKDRPGRPPVRFPQYNAWAFSEMYLLVEG
jgi:8-oxo-dGTP pyrophosphatase MutT (NUDIX family)